MSGKGPASLGSDGVLLHGTWISYHVVCMNQPFHGVPFKWCRGGGCVVINYKIALEAPQIAANTSVISMHTKPSLTDNGCIYTQL